MLVQKSIQITSVITMFVRSLELKSYNLPSTPKNCIKLVGSEKQILRPFVIKKHVLKT